MEIETRSTQVPLQDLCDDMEVESNTSSLESDCNLVSQNTVLPDLVDLDWAQITYALKYTNLLFITNHRTWINFHTNNSENVIRYNDFSPEELRNRFLKRVLPRIFQYELTQEELHILNLLHLHPSFRRTQNGFVLLPQNDNLDLNHQEAVVGKLLLRSSPLLEIDSAAVNVRSNQQIVIENFNNESTVPPKFSFSEENATLLSVVLSLDYDLTFCRLLSTEEIHKRLKAAKSRFELNGQQLENINISIVDLLKKLKAVNELKTVIKELVYKSSQMEIFTN